MIFFASCAIIDTLFLYMFLKGNKETDMKVIHLIGGGDVGGAKSHVLSLVKELSKHIDVMVIRLRPGILTVDAQKWD
jgi:hypothetical protein